MEIAVDGFRVSATDWQRVRNLPKDQLPPLTQEQKAVAAKLRVSEEDYARSALAGQETQGNLLAKTERFARLFERRVKGLDPNATVERVALLSWEHRFDIVMRIGRGIVPVRVDEAIVDDLFEGGSSEADQKLSRIVELALGQRVA